MYYYHQQPTRCSQQVPAGGSSNTNAISAVVPSLLLQQHSLVRAQRRIDDLLRGDSRTEKQLLGGASADWHEYHRLKREIQRKIDCLKCAAAAGDQEGGSGGAGPQAAASSYSSRPGIGEEWSRSSKELNSLLTRGSHHKHRYHHHHHNYPRNRCPRPRDDNGEKELVDEKLEKEQKTKEYQVEEEKATCSDAFTEEDEENLDEQDDKDEEQEGENEVVDQPGMLRDLDAAKQTQQQLLQRHCYISSQTTIAMQLLSQTHGDPSSSVRLRSSGNLMAAAGAKPKTTTMPEGAATWTTSRKLAPTRPPQFLLSAATWAAAAAASEPPAPSETMDNMQFMKSIVSDTTKRSNNKALTSQDIQQQQLSYRPSLSHRHTLICPVKAAAPVAARAHSLFTVQASIEPMTSTKTGSVTEVTPTADNCSEPAAAATTSGRRHRTEVVMPPRQQYHQHLSSSSSRKARQLSASIRRRRLQLRRDREQHKQQQRCSMIFLPSDSFSSSAPLADRRQAIDKRLKRRLTACPMAQSFFQAIEVALAAGEATLVPLSRLFESTVQDALTTQALSPIVAGVLQPLLHCHQFRRRLPTLASLCLFQQGDVSVSSSTQILPMRPLRLRQCASVTYAQSSCFCCNSWGATRDEKTRDTDIPFLMGAVLRSFQTGCRVLERLSLTARLFPYSADRPGSAGVRYGSALLQLLFYPEDVLLLVDENSSDNPIPPSLTVIEKANIATVDTSMDTKQRAIALPGATVCVISRAEVADRTNASSPEKLYLDDDYVEDVEFEEDDDDAVSSLNCWRGSYGNDAEGDGDDEWRDLLIGVANNAEFVFDGDDDGEVEDLATSDF